MGSYAKCWLGDFPVGSSKYDVDPFLMRLFRQSDKRIVSGALAGVPHPLEHWLAEADSEGGDQEPKLVYYTAPVKIVRDRLGVLGYTLETAREVFDEGLRRKRQQNGEWFTDDGAREPSETTDLLQSIHTSEQRILADLTVDSWLAAMKEIRRGGMKSGGRDYYEGPHKGTLLGYMLSNEWFAFPSPDTMAALRLTLGIYPEAEELVYDVTDLVWSGEFSEEEDLVEHVVGIPVEELQSTAKIILLTEGPSDTRILRASLELLYPHLAEYYSFMEFDAMRVGGGAGNLANLVKALAGAGIVNKVIALFDNDTAAAAAVKALAGIDVPPHIVVLMLPDLESLKAYPTIGPSGCVAMDVNGLAASIELYLGEDVLTVGEGLSPVQWTGYDTGMLRYQGQVLDKAAIQVHFEEKLRRAKVSGVLTSGSDWSGLKAIFTSVFAAFHELDRLRIVESAREYDAD